METQQRGFKDPLIWWSEVNDDLKIVFYINLKYEDELFKEFGEYKNKLYDNKQNSFRTEIESIKEVDNETILSILNLKRILVYSDYVLDLNSFKELSSLTNLYLDIYSLLDISPPTSSEMQTLAQK